MKVCAIISEYNPFHNGHKYQIDKIRETFGDDTAIIAIMSGNFTQRGEAAIVDKTLRAKAACQSGVNLVLEIPFPFSMSSSEFYAQSGVEIADSIGIVDYLVFGSECGDVELLREIATVMNSDSFSELLEKESKEQKNKNKGYPELCEIITKRLSSLPVEKSLFSPNNILAIEYIKALIRKGSNIKPVTIKRLGAGYSDGMTEGTTLQSASAIRAEITKNNLSALDYTPNPAKEVFFEAIKNGKMPTDQTKLDLSVISSFRLSSPDAAPDIQDANGGLYNRLCDISATVTSISSLTSKAETKKYTKARIRRAIWNSYFGVTSSDVRALPKYTQVLALDQTGRSLLKRIKERTDFPVITKPSSYTDFGDEVILQARMSHKVDSVYALTAPSPYEGSFSLTFTPYVKK